jgi:hypothetical protein
MSDGQANWRRNTALPSLSQTEARAPLLTYSVDPKRIFTKRNAELLNAGGGPPVETFPVWET